MKTIISRQNQQIKEAAKLKLQKERNKQEKFIAEGFRTCKTLIDSGVELLDLYATQDIVENAKKIAPEEAITIVTEPVMDKISAAKAPSGLLGVFSIPKAPTIDKIGPGVVLANMANPGNMGTLIRSCAAMGLKSVVCVDGADPWAPKVIQASAGTIAKIDLFELSWEDLMKIRGNIKLIALVVQGGKKSQEIDFKNALLVIGSEAHGLSEQWIADCDEKLTIPMPGETESLNAAVAGSIAIYLASQK